MKKLNKSINVLQIFGTRPEAIKMAPVVQELNQCKYINSIVCVTGQHRQMLDQVLQIFQINPDYDLNIMKENQTLDHIVMEIVTHLPPILEKERPDMILVHGDTSTTFAASLAAFHHQVAIGHVEAGLRTGSKYSPFPEEMNRQLTGVLADVHFTPTIEAKQNLINENKLEKYIFVTGNTAIDSLSSTVNENYHHHILDRIGNNKFILLTMHRRENLGKPMEQIFSAIKRIIAENPTVHVVYPVHLNPRIEELADKWFRNEARIHLLKPLDVIDFHNLAQRSFLILTDSGGVQEEAPSLDVPVLVLRDQTERPEGLKAGALKLAGTMEEDVFQLVNQLIHNKNEYNRMKNAKNPYGDGKASQRICQAILYYFGIVNAPPDNFI